jgi:preprotein translocase subunit SecD
MYESFHTRFCVSPRLTRKPAFVIVHTLLSLMISLCLACTTRGDASAPCPVIEMSAVADTPTDSGKTVTLNDTTTILISRTPLVATGDITRASASQTGDQWVVNFTVTDDAAKRVHDFTQQHVGKHLALVVDGKANGTPRIAGAVVGNSYRIDGLNRADAERLATAISNDCRR